MDLFLAVLNPSVREKTEEALALDGGEARLRRVAGRYIDEEGRWPVDPTTADYLARSFIRQSEFAMPRFGSSGLREITLAGMAGKTISLLAGKGLIAAGEGFMGKYWAEMASVATGVHPAVFKGIRSSAHFMNEYTDWVAITRAMTEGFSRKVWNEEFTTNYEKRIMQDIAGDIANVAWRGSRTASYHTDGQTQDKSVNTWVNNYVQRVARSQAELSERTARHIVDELVLEGRPPNVVARKLRQMWPLTPSGVDSANKYRQRLSAQDRTTSWVNRMTERYVIRTRDQRFRTFAKTESHTAFNLGREAEWMRSVGQGVLPGDTMKMWITGRDEAVCEVCAPMDGKIAPLGEIFEDINLYVPAVHPNCRCITIPVQTGVANADDPVLVFPVYDVVEKHLGGPSGMDDHPSGTPQSVHYIGREMHELGKTLNEMGEDTFFSRKKMADILGSENVANKLFDEIVAFTSNMNSVRSLRASSEHLHNMVLAAPRVDKQLYRGEALYKSPEEADEALKKGTVISRELTSFTDSKEIARVFDGKRLGREGQHSVSVRMSLAPGARGVHVEPVTNSNGRRARGFGEYLVSGDFEVVSARRNGNVMDVEIRPLSNINKHLKGKHDQKDHGSWATRVILGQNTNFSEKKLLEITEQLQGETHLDTRNNIIDYLRNWNKSNLIEMSVALTPDNRIAEISLGEEHETRLNNKKLFAGVTENLTIFHNHPRDEKGSPAHQAPSHQDISMALLSPMNSVVVNDLGVYEIANRKYNIHDPEMMNDPKTRQVMNSITINIANALDEIEGKLSSEMNRYFPGLADGTITGRENEMLQQIYRRDRDQELWETVSSITPSDVATFRFTPWDEVSKRTVIIEEYTRRDGTVVEEHERALSPYNGYENPQEVVDAIQGLSRGELSLAAAKTPFGNKKSPRGYEKLDSEVYFYFDVMKGKDAVGELVFSVHKDKTAHLNWFTLEKDQQQTGFGRSVFDVGLEALRAAGVEKAKLEANIDVGGYAWAVMGVKFDPDPRFGKSGLEERYMRHRLNYFKEHGYAYYGIVGRAKNWYGRRFSDKQSPYTAQQRTQINREIDRLIERSGKHPVGHANSPTPQDLAALGREHRWTHENGFSMWPGKEILLGSSWDGVIDLTQVSKSIRNIETTLAWLDGITPININLDGKTDYPLHRGLVTPKPEDEDRLYDEVSKRTVTVEEYTRADGTVVEEHERKIDPAKAVSSVNERYKDPRVQGFIASFQRDGELSFNEATALGTIAAFGLAFTTRGRIRRSMTNTVYDNMGTLPDGRLVVPPKLLESLRETYTYRSPSTGLRTELHNVEVITAPHHTYRGQLIQERYGAGGDIPAVLRNRANRRTLRGEAVDRFTLKKNNILVEARVYTPNGREVGKFEATIDPRKREVFQDGFFMDTNFQGTGFANDFTAHIGMRYVETGIDSIGVYAGGPVGGYAWARKGFSWRYWPSRDVMQRLEKARQRTDIYPEPVISEIKSIQRRIRLGFATGQFPKPQEISKIGREHTRVAPGASSHSSTLEMWAGKEILLGSDWHASLSIREIRKLLRKQGHIQKFMLGLDSGDTSSRHAVTTSVGSQS